MPHWWLQQNGRRERERKTKPIQRMYSKLCNMEYSRHTAKQYRQMCGKCKTNSHYSKFSFAPVCCVLTEMNDPNSFVCHNTFTHSLSLWIFLSQWGEQTYRKIFFVFFGFMRARMGWEFYWMQDGKLSFFPVTIKRWLFYSGTDCCLWLWW